MLTQAQLKEYVTYDPESGGLYWIKSRGPKAKVGARIGSRHSKGYREAKFFGFRYLEHRLVWFYHHGSWPMHDIDHINCIRDDNRIENLRDCTKAQNNQNIIKCKANNKTSGLLGVYKQSKCASFIAQIRVNGKLKNLGSFKTPEAAHEVYLAAKRKYHSHGTI